MNNLIVATVTSFSGTTTPDKNGNMPVMLQCIAGVMPNRNVLSGTVAKRLGIEIGKTYLFQVRQNGNDEFFGPDFTFVKVTEFQNGLDIVKAVQELPEAQIMLIERPQEFYDKYERKGDKVESLRSKRAKEGKYHPFFGVRNDETAEEITPGTSLTGEKSSQVSPMAQ
jgi:hypothetical protein